MFWRYSSWSTQNTIQQGSISVAFGACLGRLEGHQEGNSDHTNFISFGCHIQKPQHYSSSADRLALPKETEMLNVISFVGIWPYIKILDKITFFCQTDYNSYRLDVTVCINLHTKPANCQGISYIKLMLGLEAKSGDHQSR